jgi:tight adherence protein C
MQIALIAIMTFSTALIAVWLLLLFSGTKEDKLNMAYGVLVDNIHKTREHEKKGEANRGTLARYHGVVAKIMSIFYGSDYQKKITKLEKKSSRIQSGDLGSISIIPLPGYVVLRKFQSISYMPFFKKLNVLCLEYYGRKHATYKTNGIVSLMFSYIILGVGATLTIGSILTAFGLTQIGLSVAAIGTAIVVLFAYSKYDEVRAKTSKRQIRIIRQFPNVVSKLALLVCSGMIMDRAWKETSESYEGDLYEEMRAASLELEQNISPEEAYSSFIKRCNTKETSKLASAILQNLSKGNAEIGILLKEMAKEAWQERRHLAKRDAEIANGRLLIPIMLLLASVLIMIMVPLAMSMGIAF